MPRGGTSAPASLPIPSPWSRSSAHLTPHWTPDGSHIVFGHEGRIYVVDASGSDLKSLSGSFEPAGPWDWDLSPAPWDFSPTLSPDGSMVAYTTLRYASRTYEIATQPIDGFDCQRLTRNDWDDVSPAWSPDGSRIAFVSHREDDPRLFTITPDGADERSVAPTVRVQTDPPTWAPDGSLLAFVGEEEEIVSLTWLDTRRRDRPPVTRVSENWSLLREAVYVASTDGSSVRKLVWADATDAPPLTRVGRGDLQYHAEEDVTHFQWSPDGSQIAFVARYHAEPGGMYVANLDTAEVQQVLDLSTILDAEQYHRPSREGWYHDGSIEGIAWSPDSSRIIFEVGGHWLDEDNTLRSRSGLYSLTADGSEPPLLLDKADSESFTHGVTYWEWPAIMTNGAPPPRPQFARYSLLNYLEKADFLAGTAPARIARYTDNMNANGWQEVKGWLLTTIPWEGSGEKLLVRIVDNRLVAVRPRQDDASTTAAQCSGEQVVPGAQQNPGLVKDCRVLLGIRDVLAGDGVLYWSADFPIQEWPGVTVAGSPPRVHALTSVPGVSLTGIIPPEIVELTELRVLNLENNKLTGSIPAELGSLVNLEILDLGDWWAANNDLTGSIPPQLGNLSNLKVLDLSGNGFTGAIPPEIGKLSKLEELNLGDNPLRGSIPPELGRLKDLQVLDLGGNQIVLTGTIPAELGDMARLRYVDLRGNALTGCVPTTWQGVRKLHVKLPFCVPPLTPPDEASVAAAQCSNDKVVPGARENAGLVKDCRVLLGMRDTLAGDEVLYWSSQSAVHQWPGVTVAGNPPRVHALTSIPGVVLKGRIPPAIGDLTELRLLNLEGNRLTGSIPPELGGLANLEVLDLGDWWAGHNNLTGSIPPQLADLTNLTVLDLSGNGFDGAIPPELGRLSSLEELYLGDNPLQGSIPPELGRLKGLQVLYLGGNRNQLTGTIPAELGDLESLRELTINWTQLTGSIPPELGNLTHLWKLHLRGSGPRDGGLIGGPIPPELARLENLKELSLEDNRLEGQIPQEIGDLTHLRYVNLSGNLLTGCVPGSLQGQLDMTQSDLGGLPYCTPAPGATPAVVSSETDREAPKRPSPRLRGRSPTVRKAHERGR